MTSNCLRRVFNCHLRCLWISSPFSKSQALCSKYLHKRIKQGQDTSRVTVIYHHFTHLSNFNFALSWIPTFSCNKIELGVFISSFCLFWLRSVHWSGLSHVPNDTILVNSIKKTNVTFVISKSWLWHGLDSWKGFIAFLGGGPSSSSTTFFSFFFWKDVRHEDKNLTGIHLGPLQSVSLVQYSQFGWVFWRV